MQTLIDSTWNAAPSQAQFDYRWKALYPPLLAAARKYFGPDDAADLLQQVALNAWRSRMAYKDRGIGAFYNWLHRILENAVCDRLAEQGRRYQQETSLDALLEGRKDYGAGRANYSNSAERYWASLAQDDRRAEVSDAERAAEARYRLRFADLTEQERQCVTGRIAGQTFARISRSAGISKPTVMRRIRSATAKMQAVPLDCFAAPDLDHYHWKIAHDVVIYHAPPATGAMLAREKLAALRMHPVRPRLTPQ